MVLCSCDVLSGTVYFSNPKDQDPLQAWLHKNGTPLRVAPQVQNPNLGVRMEAALKQQLSQPSCRKALIIGTDIPDMSVEVLHQAVQALDDHDAVIGPAQDGGYYLLGLRKLPDGLFDGIEWSTETVCQQQLQRAQALGLQVAPLGTLPTLRDIDTVDDLQAWAKAQEGAGVQQPLRGVVQKLLSVGAGGSSGPA